MLSPVVAPKPRRLSSPRVENTHDPIISSERAHFFCTPESREVEQIMIKLDEVDAEKELKSPTSSVQEFRSLPDPEDLQQYSPPLRVVSPPARTANPQAAAVEAYYSSDEWAPEYTEFDAPSLGMPLSQDVEYNSDDEELVDPITHPPLFSAYSAPTTPYRDDERDGGHLLAPREEEDEIFAYCSVYSSPPLDIPRGKKGSIFAQINPLGTSPTKRKREPLLSASLPSAFALDANSLEASCVLSRAVSLPLEETSQRSKRVEDDMAYECASAGVVLFGKMRCHSVA